MEEKIEMFCLIILLRYIIVLYDNENNFDKLRSQLKFTCSKSTTETLEKGVKYVQN